jgi:hypothetical protein
MTSREVTKVAESVTMDKQTLHVVSDVMSQCDQPFIPKLFPIYLLRDPKLFFLSVYDYFINLNVFI